MIKHFVLTSGRSGSNYISNLLNKHPNVINYGEVLGEWTTGYKVNKCIGRGDAEKYLSFIYAGPNYFRLSESFKRAKAIFKGQSHAKKRWSEIQSYGVKDFAMTLIYRDAGEFLQENPDIRVINLYRENALRRLASVRLLDETGVVSSDHAQHLSSAATNKKQVYLPADTFFADIKRIEEVVQDQLDMVAALPETQVLTIRYEDLFSSEEAKQDFSQRIFDFIGVEPLTLKSSHKKLNSEDLKELIANYDEIYTLCEGTEYEKYFKY